MEIIEVSSASSSPPQRTMTAVFGFSKTNHPNGFLPPPQSLPTFSESLIVENIQNAESIIRKWDPTTPSMEKFISLFQESRKEAKEFVKCVENLRRAMHFLISQQSTVSSKLVLAQAHRLMKIAMQRLEKEFFQILSTNKEYLNAESVSSRSSPSPLSRSLSFGNSDDDDADDDQDRYNDDFDVTIPSSKAEMVLSDLKMIAESMISSGYRGECLKIFKIARKSILDEELYRLINIKSYSFSSQINGLNPQALENQASRWIQAARIAVRALFRRERLLCDHVFDSCRTIKETCFADVTKHGAVNLFKFPEIVTKSKRSPEKIFHQMNMHEAISELWPEIESIFSYEQLSPVRLQALSSLHRLSESVQTIISEYVSSIQKNSSKTTIPGGGIHPLTSSVMNYVSLLANNSGVLAEILLADDDQESVKKSPFPESYFDGSSPSSSVASKLAWIILVLLCKLDSKAELYNDIALSYLFLANNLGLVVEKVSTSVLKILLGEEWLFRLQGKVKLYAEKYEAVAWNKALLCLPAEENMGGGEISPDSVKKRFKQFNSVFEDAYRKQSSWVIPDSRLRDEIKMSIARKLVPAYREFYNSYLAILSKDENFEALVRFSPDNLGNYLSDLFHKTAPLGNPASTRYRRSSLMCL